MLEQVASGQQHESTVGMVMAVPQPPPAFLLAGQAADPWFSGRSHAEDHPLPSQAAADGNGDDSSDVHRKLPSAEPPPASDAALSAASYGEADYVIRSIAADPDRAATERGGPVYLEQPDGSVQLKLLVNPLYRPPADDAGDDADRGVPLYEAVLDETYQA